MIYSFINYLNYFLFIPQKLNIFHSKRTPIEIVRPFDAVINVTKVFLLNNVLIDCQPAFITFMKMVGEHVVGCNCGLDHSAVALDFGGLV